MSDPSDSQASAADPLDAVIADYVQQVEAGAVPDREALLATHPDLAGRLRAFFADCDRLDRQAAELRLSADANRTTDATAPVAELPRVRYFGDYELLELIARGGMGVVYKARQMSLNRLVALKMILRGELATPRDVARFRAEAEAAANLDHPHIVPIHEVGEHDGQQYYAMRYVEGTSLTRRERADARKEAGLIATVARAVHYAHQHGILHRDLKPSNILMDPAGTPFVADFGLAKRVDADRSLTEPGVLVGTPAYMAPEQAAARRDLTVAADVYSLGVVLYERLTGQTPFNGEGVEILRQVQETEPPRPSSLTPGLNRDLETICLKCLEKDPAKRYGSAEALADDLERWLRGEPIEARPVGQAERLWRWCRRNPALAGAVGAAAFFLVLGSLVASLLAVQALAEARRADQEADNARDSEKLAKENERLIREAKQLSDRRYYASEMKLASLEWEAGQIRLVEQRLRAHSQGFADADLRGFEWYYLQRLCKPELRTLEGHMWTISSVAFSPDGRRLASADGTVKVWDVATGQETLTLKGYVVAFSPDGRRLASASTDQTVKVWAAATGQELLTLKGHKKSVTSVAFSPDGRRLASGSVDWTVKVWDVATGQESLTLKGHTHVVDSVAFSPDGRRLASASTDQTVKVWDAATGQESLALKGHLDSVNCVAFSPDGRCLASASSDNTVKVWDVATGQESLTLKGHKGTVKSVAFSPDGRCLASASEDWTVKVWDVATGQETRTLKGHLDSVNCVAFSPDGRCLTSASGYSFLQGPYEATVKVVVHGPED
jgi:sugar lactone lactonase YvrE/tRNA A-37 threonylcarbamoyl transferase component Bud32